MLYVLCYNQKTEKYKYPKSQVYFEILIFAHTVESVLVAASKKWILLRLLFEGGFYLRAASNTGFTVFCLFFKNVKESKFFLKMFSIFIAIFL